MKNLYVITLFFCVLLLQSCTLEDSLSVGLALVSPSFDDSGSANISAASEWTALNKNWTNSSFDNFKAPMQYEDNLIFLGSRLRSVNKNTGIENWNLDIGHISYSVNIQPIIVADKMYFIFDDDIYMVGLDTGELLLKYEWKYPETITEQFSIQDGIMYVNVEAWEKYSAFASCPLTELHTGEWTYLNKTEAVNNVLFDKIAFTVGVNTAGQHMIYFRSELIENFSIGSDNSEVRAYNTATKMINWVYRGPSISFFKDDIFLTDTGQLIVNTKDSMHNIDTQTGRKNWEISTSRYSDYSSQSQRMVQYKDMVIFFNGAEIVTAYNINSGSKVWELSNTSFSYEEKGVTSSSINLHGDKLFYLSNWGLLMEIDLEAGTYIRHHDSLKFSGGLIVDEDENFIAYPMYGSSGLSSFSL